MIVTGGTKDGYTVRVCEQQTLVGGLATCFKMMKIFGLGARGTMIGFEQQSFFTAYKCKFGVSFQTLKHSASVSASYIIFLNSELCSRKTSHLPLCNDSSCTAQYTWDQLFHIRVHAMLLSLFCNISAILLPNYSQNTMHMSTQAAS